MFDWLMMTTMMMMMSALVQFSMEASCCVKDALLIQILTRPVDFAVLFLLLGQVTIRGQAKFSTVENTRSISNTSVKSEECGHKDLHPESICFPYRKVFFKCCFSDTNMLVIPTCIGVGPHLLQAIFEVMLTYYMTCGNIRCNYNTTDCIFQMTLP